jgi:hypothetical protein
VNSYVELQPQPFVRMLIAEVRVTRQYQNDVRVVEHGTIKVSFADPPVVGVQPSAAARHALTSAAPRSRRAW